MSEPASAETPAPAPRPRRLGRVLAVLEPLSVALGFIFMLQQSWMRWGDPLVDFPRDLYIAWRMSEGDLLYERIANWYGPLANLVEAAGFKLFGVGLDTLVWMNIALAAGILLLLRAIFGLIGNRLMVWLVSMLFICIYLVGHYSPIADYNYITPYVAQSTYSFAGLLLILWGLLKHLKTSRQYWLAVAGFGFAVAYLDKPEAVLAGGGALGFYLVAQFIKQHRAASPSGSFQRAGRGLAGSLAWLAGGFMALWTPVFLFLLAQGGFAYAFRAVNYSIISVLDSSIRDAAIRAPTLAHVAGFDHPWVNFVLQFKMGMVMLLVSILIILAGRMWGRAPRFSLSWWLLPLVAVGCAVAGGWLALASNEDFAHTLAYPVTVASAIYAVRSLRAAWRNSPDYLRLTGIAVVGLAATLMLARIYLNVLIGHYGFFMTPLAVFFWFDLMLVEATRPPAGKIQSNRLAMAVFAAVIVTGGVRAADLNRAIYQRKNYAIGEGRDGFLTAAGTVYPFGWMLADMLAACHQYAPHARSLLVLPEGIAVNYHLRIPTPLSQLEYQPVALGYAGLPHVLEELKSHPPDAILIYSSDMSDYGVKYFGADRASGRDILDWINENYVVVVRYQAESRSTPVFSTSGDIIDLLLPKPGRVSAGSQSPPLPAK